MSEAKELFNPSRHPAVHPSVMEPFVHANLAFPQMYGGMILRAGRVAYDLMVAGKLSPSTFSRSLPNDRQTSHMGGRAEYAHEKADLDIRYLPHGTTADIEAGHTTPVSMRGVYMRTRRGILRAIHSYAITVLDLPMGAPADVAAERLFMAKQLLKRENRPAALLLQTMWQTADEAATGRPIAETTAMMHRTFSTLPPDRNEQMAATAIATRAARTVFDSLVVPALETLKPEAAKILGNEIHAEDVIDMFPYDVIHEGADEFTDEYIEQIRTTGRCPDNL